MASSVVVANNDDSLVRLLTERVKQLTEDIEHLQDGVRKISEEAISKISQSKRALNYIAQSEGYANFDEYEKAILDCASGSYHDIFGPMKIAVEAVDRDLALSHKIFRAIGSLVFHAIDDEHGVSPEEVGVRQSFVYAFAAISGGYHHWAKGSTEKADKLFNFSKEALVAASHETHLSKESIKALQYILLGHRFAADILNTANGDTHDLADTNALKRRLRKLAASRFIVSLILAEAGAYEGYRHKAHELVQVKVEHIALVKVGQETPQEADEILKGKMFGIAEEFRGIFDNVARISPQAVFEKLRGLDAVENVWADEDPTLEQIEAVIYSL